MVYLLSVLTAVRTLGMLAVVSKLVSCSWYTAVTHWCFRRQLLQPLYYTVWMQRHAHRSAKTRTPKRCFFSFQARVCLAVFEISPCQKLWFVIDCGEFIYQYQPLSTRIVLWNSDQPLSTIIINQYQPLPTIINQYCSMHHHSFSIALWHHCYGGNHRLKWLTLSINIINPHRLCWYIECCWACSMRIWMNHH